MIKTMFPSKSAVDYMTEINRLFPRGHENDMLSYMSPINQSITGNRSSSSADSTSPEYYISTPTTRGMPYEPAMHDMSFESPRPIIRAETPPFVIRRQRPIIGRKIFAEKPEIIPPTTTELPKQDPNWLMDEPMILQQTPPNSSTLNYNYELFPPENRRFELKTPVRSVSTMSLNSISSTFSSVTANISPPVNKFIRSPSNFPQNPQFTPPFNPMRCSPRPKYQMRYWHDKPQKLCTFCRKNGETPIVFMSHTIREWIDNKQVVSCPILRSHVCSTCGATGDEAHTITYCPVVRNSNNGQPVQSTTITLKSTRIMSNGKRRY